MSTEEQLVNYVRHTRGFIQTFFYLTHSFPVHPFSTLWKRQNVLRG